MRTLRCLGAGLVLSGLILAASPRADAQTTGFIVQGQAPPDFSLPDATGRQVRLSDFKGRVILLSFWSCYTDTCFASLGPFQDLLAKLGPRGLAAPTVCQEVPPALAADGYAGLLKRCSAGQAVLIDEERRVGAMYAVDRFPASLLIGPDFTVREIIQGVAPLRDPAFFAKLEAMVDAAAAGVSPRP